LKVKGLFQSRKGLYTAPERPRIRSSTKSRQEKGGRDRSLSVIRNIEEHDQK